MILDFECFYETCKYDTPLESKSQFYGRIRQKLNDITSRAQWETTTRQIVSEDEYFTITNDFYE